MSNPLEKELKTKIENGKKIFCAFFTLGYKSLKDTEEWIRICDKLGVDIVELGIPFSDPMADGPTIQDSSQYALDHRIRIKDAFSMVKRLRASGVRVPIIFFSYYNIVLQIGLFDFVKQLKSSGFNGVLCPDLPPEEDDRLGVLLRRNQMSQIFLVAPTTTEERIRKITKKGSGFIYYVSRKGVTGKQNKLAPKIKKKISEIKKVSSLPVLVGFGVSSAEQVKKLLKDADGVIVGSALVEQIKQSGKNKLKVRKYLENFVQICHPKA